MLFARVLGISNWIQMGMNRTNPTRNRTEKVKEGKGMRELEEGLIEYFRLEGYKREESRRHSYAQIYRIFLRERCEMREFTETNKSSPKK